MSDLDKFCNKIPYAINRLSGDTIDIDDYNISNKGYICCPYCKEDVIYRGSNIQNKDGTWRKKHYSHRPNSVCTNKVSSEGESIEHKKSKEYIFNLLKGINDISLKFKLIKLSKEYQFINKELNINRVADVYVEFIYEGLLYKQAYEIQYSNITEEEFELRHNDYIKLGIQDIWFIGLQYKNDKNNLKEKSINIEEELDDGCKFIGDTSNFYYRDTDINTRNFLSRIVSSYDISKKSIDKKSIDKKSISLYNKVSTFQNIIYLISQDGLHIPKTIKTKFVCAKSKILYDDSLFFTIEEFKNYKKNSPFNHDEHYTLELVHTKTIGDFHLFNYNLLHINEQELNEDFFVSGDNKLFHLSKSELEYADLKIKEFKGILQDRENIKIYEENINKYKYVKPEYAKIYLIRLITEFIIAVNVKIDIDKDLIRKKSGDSFQWINKTLLTKNWKDKNIHGFFSSINKVLKNFAHIIPYEFVRSNDNLMKKINDIITFIDNVKCDYYGIDYNLFIKEFNNFVPKGIGNFQGLYSNFFNYGLKAILTGYCPLEIKGDLNLFMYKSIFLKNKNDFENRIIKEKDELVNLNNEIQDIYLSM
nr:competence protein CoiA family protein [Candidatus Gracilibacteria bacterium]